MKLVNLTPHAIVLRREDGGETTLHPTGQIARVISTPGPLVHRPQSGLPVPVFGADQEGEIVGLPEPDGETQFIVSNIVADRVPDRSDVVCPATGPQDRAIRNDHGQIIAVTRLKLGRLSHA